VKVKKLSVLRWKADGVAVGKSVKRKKNKTQKPYMLLRLETLNMIVLPAKSQRRMRSYGKDGEGEQGFPLLVEMEKLDQTK